MNKIKVFLCGDVMTGRGIDQILPNPGNPNLFEPYVNNAQDYIKLAEQTYGPISKPADYSYIWGVALQELKMHAPDVRIANLETAITKSDRFVAKGINYRMNPANIAAITSAHIDICALSNNHIIDWGYEGLTETIETLHKVGIQCCGAGRNIDEAQQPAITTLGKGRVLVFSMGHESSGIPSDWQAENNKPGIFLLNDLSDKTVTDVKSVIERFRKSGDVVIASIHWGENWGYDIPISQIEFAHMLINKARVDIIHGHSSHHVKAIEVYKNKLILYGCGDFINDYEGISGYEEFRDDLGLMYFAIVEPSSGKLSSLEMTPTQIRKFCVNYASREDSGWLLETLNSEGRKFNTSAKLNENNRLSLHWS